MKIRKDVGIVERYVLRRLAPSGPAGAPNPRRPEAARERQYANDPGNPDAGATSHAPNVEPPTDARTYDDGYEEGMHEGYDKGFQEGAKAAEQQLTSALDEHFNSLLEAMKVGAEAIDKEGERLREQFEAWLPRAVLLVSEAVLQREVQTNVATLIPVVQSCLADLPQGEPISVRLNPADHLVLAEQPEDLWNNDRLTLVPDESVSRGGAVVEGGSRVVDARLESRLLEAARQLLFPQEASADDGADGP